MKHVSLFFILAFVGLVAVAQTFASTAQHTAHLPIVFKAQPTAIPPTAVPPTATPRPTPNTCNIAPAPVCSCRENTLNCSDFDNNAQAQACYDHCTAIGRGDVHRLDGNDNDGLACEGLPMCSN